MKNINTILLHFSHYYVLIFKKYLELCACVFDRGNILCIDMH